MNEQRLSTIIEDGIKLWDTSWPKMDLEHLKACPLCEAHDRTPLYEELVDNTFYSAPGKWVAWLCLGCNCAYLNPRPSRDSIHLAYRNYYTHGDPLQKLSYQDLSSLRKLGRRLGNGYGNYRFSACNTPADSFFGPIVLAMLWPLRLRLDHEFRHLPRRPARGGTVLDLGCGNGAFLQSAKSCGWEVVGVDPDPEAAANGIRMGLNIHLCSVEEFDAKDESFDVITLSHVIEHVHDPIQVLKSCYRLLKNGGQLWLETPNIDSFGHELYGRNWRGLEPPRHLQLFNQTSLNSALQTAGFVGIRTVSGPQPLVSLVKASEAIKSGRHIDERIRLPLSRRWLIAIYDVLEGVFPARREFLTKVATK
jgi:2-polyprenyl-3-methyl-5-hydroxy-6-metoxy-1,4-benzoquinol methylase